MRRRLDTELVRRGLVASRTRAVTEIEAGRVVVAGAPATKAATLVAPAQPIAVLGPPPRFVGRGGQKLAAALDRFDVDVSGSRALDAGASTGGFTDCLLQRGAASVVAVDVGYGQLHERLRADPRVEVRERTDIRSLAPSDIGGRVDLVVADVSFISLCTVLANLVGLATSGATMIVLVKPQFEAGRQVVSKGRGVVRDPLVWRQVLNRVREAVDDVGATMMGAMVSPLTGADGNVEFLLHLVATSPPSTPGAVGAAVGVAAGGVDVDLDAVVAEAVALHQG